MRDKEGSAMRADGWGWQERRHFGMERGGKWLRERTARGAEGMKGGLVQGERKRRRGGTGEAREMHFRQHEGEREAEGSVLPLTLQTHSSMRRDITH